MERKKAMFSGKRGYFFTLKESFRLCFADYRYFLGSFLIDLLFFFLFAVIYSFFSINIMGHLIEVSGMMSGISSSMTAIGPAGQGLNETVMAELVSNQQILAENFEAILLLSAGAIVSLYLLWVILQGFNWKLAADRASKGMQKVKLLRYISQFSLLNFIWMAAALALAYGVVQLSIYNDFARIKIVSQGTIDLLTVILFAVLFYFVAVSYALVGKMKAWRLLKRTFVLGVRKAFVFLPAIALVLLLSAAIILAVSLFQLGLVATVLIDLLLLLPAVSFGRMLMIVCGENSMPR